MKTSTVTNATEVIAASNVNPTDTYTRKYRLTSTAPTAVKSAQRQIVLNALRASDKPLSALDIEPIAAAAGLVSKTPVKASVRFHLHNMKLLGHAEIV
jgi:hypothetical protein